MLGAADRSRRGRWRADATRLGQARGTLLACAGAYGLDSVALRTLSSTKCGECVLRAKGRRRGRACRCRYSVQSWCSCACERAKARALHRTLLYVHHVRCVC